MTSATCATRSCTSSRRPTRPSRRSRTSGPASATRSSSSAATASGTATSTPTTSAPPIEAALDCGRPRNIRVTDLLEQVAGGEVGAGGGGECRGRAGERARRRPRSSPSAPATASAASSARSACSALVAGGQSMNPSTAQLLEAVDGGAGRRGRDPARTTRTSSRWPNRSTSSPTRPCAWCRPPAWPRASPRCSSTTPMPRPTTTRRPWRPPAAHVIAAEVTQAVRDSDSPAGAIAEGDWLGLTRFGHPGRAADLDGCGDRRCSRSW